jgi:hypothetical protein
MIRLEKMEKKRLARMAGEAGDSSEDEDDKRGRRSKRQKAGGDDNEEDEPQVIYTSLLILVYIHVKRTEMVSTLHHDHNIIHHLFMFVLCVFSYCPRTRTRTVL